MKHLPVNGDSLRGLCDHLFWHDAAPHENRAFRQGDAVFCKIDEVWRIFRALRRTRKRIVLVTGEGDKPVTPALWARKPPHVFHWFGTNNFVEDSCSTPLPLGIGNAGARVTPSWTEMQEVLRKPPKRSKILYANFGTASNPAVREPLLHWVQSQGWITTESHSAQSGKAGYLQNLCSHHFVFCPPGNGEDTHRMWESLYCGAIPIVRESPATRQFKALPILFVSDLTGLSEISLQEALKTWETRNFTLEMLDAAFWEARIADAKAQCTKAGSVTIGEWLHAWLSEIRAVLFKAAQPLQD